MSIKYFIKNQFKNKIVVVLCALSIIIPCIYSIPRSQHASCEPRENTIDLPVIMYHMVVKNPKSKNKFTVSTDTLEQDLQYIKNNGYTTILVSDLIEYTENKKDLPKKPILLTFDDGAYNNYLYAFPLAKKYDAKFVFSPIAYEAEKYSKIIDENPNYSHAN